MAKTVKLTVNQTRATSGMRQVADILKGKSIVSVGANGLGLVVQTASKESIYIGWDAATGPFLERVDVSVTIPDIDVETVTASVQGG